MTPDPAELAAWTRRQHLTRLHYAAMPIASHNSGHPTPCIRCLRPTRETKGVCPTCRKKKP